MQSLMLLSTLASGLPTFNVRDFGAVGDATADDTAAFQAAIDNATAAARDLPFEGFLLQSRAELFIPRGHYRLTRTLTLPRLAPDLRGESRPVLRMDDAAQDIIFGSAVWRWQATGLALAGGKSQLHIGNNNTDQGFINIQDCTFAHASGAAIRIVGPGCQGCPVGVDNCPTDPHCPANALPQVGSYSSQVIVKDCMFSENYQTLIVWSDWGVFSDSWISSSCDMNDAAIIENHDKLFISNILGVPCNTRYETQAISAPVALYEMLVTNEWFDNALTHYLIHAVGMYQSSGGSTTIATESTAVLFMCATFGLGARGTISQPLSIGPRMHARKSCSTQIWKRTMKLYN